jgi:hypothetical protein
MAFMTIFDSPHGVMDDLIIDFGVYGRIDHDQGAAYTRKLDIWTLLQGARKMVVYTCNYIYTRLLTDFDIAIVFFSESQHIDLTMVFTTYLFIILQLYSQHTYSKSEFWYDSNDRTRDDEQKQIAVGGRRRNDKVDIDIAPEDYEHSTSRLNRAHYEKLRKKYGAEGVFPDLYDKVCGQEDAVYSPKEWRDRLLVSLAVLLSPFRLISLIISVVSDRLRYLLTWLLM